MSCCGQKRALLNTATHSRSTPRSSLSFEAGASVAYPSHAGDVMVRYIGAGALSIRGPRTGRVYYVLRPGAVIGVEAKDVDGLLRTQVFVR
jgi:hypothetical protein